LIIFGLMFLVVSCGRMQLPYFAGVSVDDKFTRFPVDLARLFYDDDPAYYASALLNLTSGTMFISPFSRHVSGAHPEGYGKWYMRSNDRAMEVYLPIQAILFSNKIGLSDATAETTVTYEGNSVYVDLDVNFQVNQYVWINFDHIELLVSLKAAVDSSEDGYVILPAGTHVGYILPTNYNSSGSTGTMDFQVTDSRVNQGVAGDPSYHMNRWSYPLPYFSDAVQSDITTRYAALYNRLAVLGRSPESKLDSPLDINIVNSPWGVWYYKSGDLTATDDYYLYFLGIIAFLKHPEETNAETFLYDPRNTTQEVAIPSGLEGFFGYSSGTIPAKYSFLTSHTTWSVFLVSGNADAGVYQIYKDMTNSRYMKFAFVENDSSDKWDDEVKIEFFTTSSEASGAFQTPLTYKRDPSS
ncbi:MAG: hypothetical protein KJ732_04860, partial [Candidatus Margulisbacteria bacterium]|nr:hypothetical protein [Candidatus Margulisiibacteriota bacterium]